MMTLQEIFDKVSNHLMTQLEQSYDGQLGVCAYRSGNLKCAIGCLIPDKLYSRNMERKDIYVLIAVFPELKDLWGGTPAHLNLLCVLQHIHDITESPKKSLKVIWFDNLVSTAKRFNLSDVEVQKYT